MQNYKPMIGITISKAAGAMVQIANETNDTVTAKFNDIDIKANPCNDPQVGVSVIMACYNRECEGRAEAYRNSSERKKATVKAEEDKRLLQFKMNEMMIELQTLDFSNLSAVINWFEKVRDPSDHIGVATPSKEIVKTFRKHGFKLDVNCGDDFNSEDEGTFARWLIGQALSNLKHIGAIHQVFHKFAEEWRMKFDHVYIGG